MSQSRTFEGRTIEEALRDAAAELGPDVEVVDAAKERRGGVFGFFAKERFVVTATHPEASQKPDDFGNLLLQMAGNVTDTYEPSLAPTEAELAEAHLADAALAARAREVSRSAAAIERGSVGVIDLREGRRVARTASASAGPEGFSFGGNVRPSQLRRRLEPEASAPRQPTTFMVPGPLPAMAETAPRWSAPALRALGLPEAVIATVEGFDPVSDVEWVHAVAIGIGRLMPDGDDSHLHRVAGDGHASAVDLVRAIERGMIPAYMVVDGHNVRATPDELALAIRECLR